MGGEKTRSACDAALAEAGEPLPSIDEGRAHAGRLGTDAVEGVIGHKKHFVHANAEQFCGRRVGGHVRFEGRHRNEAIERNPVILLGALQHVPIAIGEHHEVVARLQTGEGCRHFREGRSFSISATR